MSQSPPPIPIPVPNFDNAGFWEACQRGELCLQRCLACRSYRHHPRPMCPHCNSLEYEWAKASGHGEVYTFTVAHGPTLAAFQSRIPYNVIVVRLQEGPFLVSNLVGMDNSEIRIGMPVEVVFEDLGTGFSVPRFRPRRL